MGRDSRDENALPPPVKGMDMDIEGPTADHLINMDEVYDRVVYAQVHASKDEWDIVNESEAEPYLPRRTYPLNVTLGIEEKHTIELPTLKHTNLSDHLKYKKGYVINTGSSIWGLDFVPQPSSTESDPLQQYLAVGGYRGSVEENVGMEETHPTGTYYNCIQIWKMKLSVKAHDEDPFLDLCLLHDYGVMFDLKWCPYGTYEEGDRQDGLAKLGILSFSCGDGTIRTVIVPHPDAIRQHITQGEKKTVYLRIKSSRCTFAIKSTVFMPISWGGHTKLAAGCNLGVVTVWDMASALAENQTQDINTCRRFLLLSTVALQSSVRCLTWNGIKAPERLLVGGYDGQLVLIDINDPVMKLLCLRSRNVMNSCAWASHTACMVHTDGEGNVRGLAYESNGQSSWFKYALAPGFGWSTSASEHHGQFAVGTSLGCLITSNIYQMRSRSMLVSHMCVYKLGYSDDTDTYRYADGIGRKSIEQAKKTSTSQEYGECNMAIQKVTWNPNKRTCGFIASGGAAGLCRIEFEGRGSKWE